MNKILEVKDLRISFRTANGKVQAVRDISFDLFERETLAIVGESGSGKSVTTRAILGISALNAVIENGEILYDGKDILKFTEEEFQSLRGDKIAMIFQDPMSSLNPIVKVGKQLTEAMLLKSRTGRREGRRDFYRYLKALHASGRGNSSEQELFRLFIRTEKTATRLQNSYKQARENAEEAKARIADLLVAFEKKEAARIQRECLGILRYASTCKNAFLPALSSEHYHALLQSVASGNARQNALTELNSILEQALSEPEPDFFTTAYDAVKSTSSPSANEFEKALSDAIASALTQSHKLHAQKQEAFLPVLRDAVNRTEKEWDKKQIRALVKKLTAGVNDCIDRAQIAKNSTEHTFAGCINSCCEKYFRALVKNRKEQAKFDRQTARREKLIRRGKHPDWKIAPAAITDTDLIKKRMREAIVALIRLYEERRDAIFNAEENAQQALEYLKHKAAQTTARVTKNAAKRRAIRLLNEVGIPDPEKRYNQYPFQLSGGQRQRIVIAIALSADPEILICDEPTTALDVTIQSQILELINKIKRERNLSVIFITHDLGVVANIADRIAVMYAGKIVEYGTSEEIFYSPAHPYTWALLSSVPDLESTGKLEAIPGTPPNMIYPPKGDAFADRNRYALEIDFKQQPPMFQISETHFAATWLLHPLAPKVEMPKAIKDRIRRMKEEAEREQ